MERLDHSSAGGFPASLPPLPTCCSYLNLSSLSVPPSSSSSSNNGNFPDLASWKSGPGPTLESHYVLGGLVAGGVPKLSEAEELSKKCDLIVCLVGEITSQTYFNNPALYPSRLSTSRCCLLHFPISDFHPAPSDSDVIKLVKFISHAILKLGKTVFVHCRGGHGRTTIVAMLCLCEIKARTSSGGEGGDDEVRRLLEKYRQLHCERRFCRFICQLPESDQQMRQIFRLGNALLNREPGNKS